MAQMGAPSGAHRDTYCPPSTRLTHDEIQHNRQNRRQVDNPSADALRGWTYTAQQQKHQAQLCRRLLGALQRFCGDDQDPHQRRREQQYQQHRLPASLATLADRASACAENGDARGATAAVVSFLKDFAVYASPTAGTHHQQKALLEPAGIAVEAAQAALFILSDYCRSSITANAAELIVQRHTICCVCALLRAAPQLGSAGSAALKEALAVAAAAVVVLHRVLGSEPRPRTDRGLQRYLQQQQLQRQQQQHILASGLAASQPKHIAVAKALLLSIHSLLAELARTKNTPDAATKAGLAGAENDKGVAFPAAAPPGAVGELSIELLLLLLPLALAEPSAAALQQPLQLRNAAAVTGWGPSCGLATDFASTQESEIDSSKTARSPTADQWTCVGRPWRRGLQESSVSSSSRGTPGLPATRFHGDTTACQLESASRGHALRLECLRCIEGLLRLCGRELFAYWGLLLQCKGPSPLPRATPNCNAAASVVLPDFHSPAATDEQRPSPVTCSLRAKQMREETVDKWLSKLLGMRHPVQHELPWACFATAEEGPKVSKAAVGCLCALLEASPLRQWPVIASTCMRCGPKAVLMKAEDWEKLMRPLGFGVSESYRGRSGGLEGIPHSLGCPALPTRQQHSAGPGSYTSLSCTVAQVSRCAVFSLLSLVCYGFAEETPQADTGTAKPSADFSANAAILSRRTGAPNAAEVTRNACADAASEPALLQCGPIHQHSTLACAGPPNEKESLNSHAGAALRGLAEALPALPVGILQPGIAAAALRLAHPVVFLLAEALCVQLKRQQLLIEQHSQPQQQQQELPCYFCTTVKVTEVTAHEQPNLSTSAANMIKRSKAAPTCTNVGTASAAASSADTASSSQAAKNRNCERSAVLIYEQEKNMQPQRDVVSLEGYEFFVAQVLARGTPALRLVGPTLSMVAAVVGKKQRLSQIAEALLVPLRRGGAITGPCSLPSLICKSIQTLVLMWQNCLCIQTPPAHEDCTMAHLGCSAEYQGSKGGCIQKKGLQSRENASPAATTHSRGQPRGAVDSGICSNCERSGLAVLEGLFSVLQAIARRYPQVLLLPQAARASSTATDAEVKRCQDQHVGCLQSEKEGSFTSLLRTLFSSAYVAGRCKGIQIALEVLGGYGAPAAAEHNEGANGRPASPHEFVSSGTSSNLSEPLSREDFLKHSRATLVSLLQSELVSPLMTAAPTASPAALPVKQHQERHDQEQQQQKEQEYHPDQLSSACIFLCRLTFEEWQRHRLINRHILRALRSAVLPSYHRSVRVAAAAALGAFSAHTLTLAQQQQSSSLPRSERATSAATGAPGDTALEEHELDTEGLLREAIQILLLQLTDALHDMRAASLCAICEAAGAMRQQAEQQHGQQQQQRKQQEHPQEQFTFQGQNICVGSPATDLWGQVLKGVNDVLMLQQTSNSIAVAVGLRAIGAVVPLVLLPCFVATEKNCQLGIPPTPQSGSRVDLVAESQNESEALCMGDSKVASQRPLQEVMRSLIVLDGVLRPAWDHGADRREDRDTPKTRGRQEIEELQRFRSSTGDYAEEEATCAPHQQETTVAGSGANVKQLKLHWNACNSIRLLFSSTAAFHLLISGCCKFFKPLWMGACGCLHASQLTKVRSHAAAALAAMVQHLRTPLRRSGKNMKASVESGPNGFEGTPIQQLHCASCMAPLLTQAWKALTAAAAETSGLTSSLNSEARQGRRAVLSRYKDSLRWNLESLLDCGLLRHTEELLAATCSHVNFVTSRGDPSEHEPEKFTLFRGAQMPKWALSCDYCCAVGDKPSTTDVTVFEALKEAAEEGMQAGSFERVKLQPDVAACR